MERAQRSFIRTRLVPLLAGLALVLFVVPGVSAASDDKWGTVDVIDAATGQQIIVDGEPQVCDFWFEFDLNVTADVVGWEIRDDSGKVVDEGSGGPTDAQGRLRQPASGSLSLDEGHYTVVWDDEVPVDDSNGEQGFNVVCPQATPSPSPTEVPATPSPTTAPTGTVLPATGTPRPTAPGGGVEAATGTPRVTLPPTDTGVVKSGGSSGTAVVLIGLAFLAAAISIATGRRYGFARNRRRR